MAQNTYEEFLSARDLKTGKTFEEYARQRGYTDAELREDHAFAQEFAARFDALRDCIARPGRRLG